MSRRAALLLFAALAASTARPAAAAEAVDGVDAVEVVDAVDAPPCAEPASAHAPHQSAMTPPAASPRARGRLLVPAAEAAGVQLFVMGWNVWPGETRWSNVSAGSIWRNARSAWVIDDDEFYTNQLLHPYQGSLSFAAARSAGLGFWHSVPYAVLSSLSWELAGETERPSMNDQVTTMFGGVLLGELAYRFASALHGRARGWGDVPAALLSPFAAVNRAVLGARAPETAEPEAWEMTAGAIGARVPGPGAGATPGWKPEGRLAVAFVHGVPWHPDLEIKGPLDHYRLELGYGRGADVRATLLLRGLLAGRTFEANGWRGVSGLFGLFDLDTPGDFRVSSSGLGAGGSAGIELEHGLALEATAIGGLVAMGAAGEQPELVPDGRDYLLGPGTQLVAELALTARERASIRLGVRHYALFGADGSGAREQIAAVRAAGLFRLAGVHGVGVEVSLLHRGVSADGAGFDQVGRALQVFYVRSAMRAPGSSAGARTRAPVL